MTLYFFCILTLPTGSLVLKELPVVPSTLVSDYTHIKYSSNPHSSRVNAVGKKMTIIPLYFALQLLSSMERKR